MPTAAPVTTLVLFGLCAWGAHTQSEPRLPLSPDSFRQIYRIKQQVPPGRSATLSDVIIRHYGRNSSCSVAYRVRDAKRLLDDPDFDPTRPTLLYAHGYVELASDESVLRVVEAYRGIGACAADCTHCLECADTAKADHCKKCEECGAGRVCAGAWNVLVLDWANLGYGSYVAVALDLKPIGTRVGAALHSLAAGGLHLPGLHLVGHSMGAHLLAFAARELQARGYTVPRLTGLDPAYPGFYPALLATPMSAADAGFVLAVHSDAGGFGAPSRTAHADFWPNGGGRQPGCPSATIPLTVEDLCSHWRSWALWSEAAAGGRLAARPCRSYDAFLRGDCRNRSIAYLGPETSTQLRGNFYLRTAARAPFALGERGAD